MNRLQEGEVISPISTLGSSEQRGKRGDRASDQNLGDHGQGRLVVNNLCVTFSTSSKSRIRIVNNLRNNTYVGAGNRGRSVRSCRIEISMAERCNTFSGTGYTQYVYIDSLLAGRLEGPVLEPTKRRAFRSQAICSFPGTRGRALTS